jgi:8-oxo-dGTP diphosphatase
LWFRAQALSLELNCTAPEATREHIVQARWFSANEVSALEAVFPPLLKDAQWLRDVRESVPTPRLLGVREMAFH